MELFDFHQHSKLNQLREKIGTEQFGHFELFDPVKHLNWQERKTLSEDWLRVSCQSLYGLPDQSLAFKNSHVLSKENGVFHFALCDRLKKYINVSTESELPVSLNSALMSGEKVCEFCLHAAQYQGFDVYRHRHKEYNEKISKGFNLSLYLKEKYPR